MKSIELLDLVEGVSNWQPQKSPGETFTYLDLGSIDNKKKAITRPQVMPTSDAPSRARQLVRKGDVLVSTVRPNLNAVACVGREFDGATASTGFTVLRPTESLDSRYLFHWVQSPTFVHGLIRQATGASYPAVSDSIIKSSRIPVPESIEGQRQIAHRLDEVLDLISARSKSLDYILDLKQAIFENMSPRAPITEKLGTLLDDAIVFTDGDWVESKDQDPRGNVRLIQLADIGDGLWLNKSRKYMNSETVLRLKCTKLEPGDVLVARMPDPLGRACIFPGLADDAVTAVDVCVIRPNPNTLNSVWLAAALNHPRIRSKISNLATGATRQRISRINLATLEIPMWDLKDQLVFEKRMAALEQTRLLAEKSLEALHSFYSSTRNDLFGSNDE